MTRFRRICLYSPADLNIVSGSSVWVQSVAAALASGPDVHVTIPLRCPDRRHLITDELRRLPGVDVVEPRRIRRFVPSEGLYLAEALDLIELLDREEPFAAILIRSFASCRGALDRQRLRSRLWSTYVLEPERDPDDRAHLAELGELAGASARVVVQSEEMRALFEALVPAGRGKTVILPPAVPPTPPGADEGAPFRRRMLYAGKFHPFYPVPRMVDLFVELRAADPTLEFHVIGDQVFRPAGDQRYADELEHRLTTTAGVTWHGALARPDTIAFLAQGGVALSLWDYRHGSTMNDLVVSTKLLDYCTAGVPVILNRTAAQEGILGADYPLFVRDVDEALPLLRALLADRSFYEAMARRCRAAARPFEYERVYAALAPDLEGRPDASLRQFERSKLEGAQYNLGVPLPRDVTAIPPEALRLLAVLRRVEPRFRLIAGVASDEQAPPPGADPAASLLSGVDDELQAAVSARTVDDRPSWWRTLGFVVGSGAMAGRGDEWVVEAAASGAVPLLVGGPRGGAGGPFAHASVEAAAAFAGRLVAGGGWASASRVARSFAFGDATD
ncbi:MAG TPA: hypothetical protein VK592_02260 [Candidatus Dormibacteraeota bacterium]|nr:hypothetical protein [Candidatus Dormibacteraeota bacterium]